MYEYELSNLNSLIPDAQYAVRFHEVVNQIQVPCTTIDEFCAKRGIERIDVLKIDTEGFDLEVLKGAHSMIAQRAISFIYFEFNDIHAREGASGGALAPIDLLLRDHDFRFFATYNDFVVSDGDPFIVSNALYALPPL